MAFSYCTCSTSYSGWAYNRVKIPSCKNFEAKEGMGVYSRWAYFREGTVCKIASYTLSYTNSSRGGVSPFPLYDTLIALSAAVAVYTHTHRHYHIPRLRMRTPRHNHSTRQSHADTTACSPPCKGGIYSTRLICRCLYCS